MSVFLPLLDEFGLQVVQLVLQLFTHGLSEGVAFASGEAGQLSAQEHHLLLVDGDSVGVLQVFFHLGKVVLDRLDSELAVNEVRDVVHRARTVEGVHRNQVLKALRMEFL